MKTKTQILADRIESIVHSFANRLASAPRKVGSDALAHSLGLPDTQHVAVLLQSGRLKPVQLHRNAPQTALFFSAQEIAKVRREVLRGIAEQVIQDYAGDVSGLPAAVHAALSDYVKSLEDGTAAKGFARPDASRALAFAYTYVREEERPGLLRRAATVAAVGGAAYGGLSYLRGRASGVRGFVPAVKAGNAANVADIRRVGSRVLGMLGPRPRSAAPKV